MKSLNEQDLRLCFLPRLMTKFVVLAYIFYGLSKLTPKPIHECDSFNQWRLNEARHAAKTFVFFQFVSADTVVEKLNASSLSTLYDLNGSLPSISVDSPQTSAANDLLLSRFSPLSRRIIDCKYSLASRRTLALPRTLPPSRTFCFNGVRIFVGALNHENSPPENLTHEIFDPRNLYVYIFRC